MPGKSTRKTKPSRASESAAQRKAPDVDPALRELQVAADQARAAFDYESAIEQYTRALDLLRSDSGALTQYNLLSGRAECYSRLGHLTAQAADLAAMVQLAQDMGDVARQIDALNRRIEPMARLGNTDEARRAAETALALARDGGDWKREADSLHWLGWVAGALGDSAQGQKHHEEALHRYRELGDRSGEANCLWRLAWLVGSMGHTAQALEHAETALTLYRALGDPKGEAEALHMLGVLTGDRAQARKYDEAALPLLRAIGDRPGLSIIYNSLGLLYGKLGLYSTARGYAEQAVNMARQMQAHGHLAYYLESLGRTYLDLGEQAQAQPVLEEGRDLAQSIGLHPVEATYWLALGRVALAVGQPDEARKCTQAACNLFREGKTPAELATALAWLGAAYLALDEWEAAHRSTSAAVAQLDALGNASSEYPPQDVWWLHYQVLTAKDEGGRLALSEVEGMKDEASSLIPHPSSFEALQKAHELTLAGIATLSDEGLRRNYLNKVQINRDIIAEWTRQAAARGISIEEEAARPGNLQEQFKRLLAIGVRMNEPRDVDALLDFIMDQLIELSGTERALLVFVDDVGERQVVAARGYAGGELGQLRSDDSLAPAAPVLPAPPGSPEGGPVAQAQVSVAEGKRSGVSRLAKIATEVATTGLSHDLLSLLDDVARAPRAILSHAERPSATSHQPSAIGHQPSAISQMCIPLTSRGQLLGLIYAENPVIFGRFTDTDVDLLSAFANQAASAIENARLYQGLEQRVAERTAQLANANEALEQRAAELQIINSVQQGLAAQLDMQAIYDLVSNKIRDIFDVQVVSIETYDYAAKQSILHLAWENGEPVRREPLPFNPIDDYLIESRQAFVINENVVQTLRQFGVSVERDTDKASCVVWAPLVVGDVVKGNIGLQKEKAFRDSDVRLLTTLANSMSVALENARLFDETQRLFKAEQQRAAELAIINSVQQGLAAQLDMQAIYDLVGDEIRKIFDAQVVSISTYNHEARMVHQHYVFEKGERFYPESIPFTGFTEHLIRTRQPFVVHEDFERRMAELGIAVYIVPGTVAPQSVLTVPLIAGGEVRGAVSLQNVDRENAFSESDLRLLTTLAASMSVALENARLFAETKRLLAETDQRAAELSIINSVGQALASQLDMQAVFDLVGEKIGEIFDAQGVLIETYDREHDLLHFPYLMEKGERIFVEPSPLGAGFAPHIITTREPLVINRNLSGRAAELGSTLLGGEMPKSYLGVPLIVGGESKGVIALENIDHENAFSDSDVRLLTTLASSMSVALENARLFAETKRLLAETDQRAAELTIINSVQQGLAAKLDMQAVYDLVGDRIRDIFSADTTYIARYDRQRNLILFPYYVDRGQRLGSKPVPFGPGLTSTVIETRQPLLLGTAQEADKLGALHVAYREASQDLNETYLGVPVVIGSEVTGVISVQSYRQHAYDDSHVRLLTTLANSMSVALENARLFDETQRLLKETEQRAAELEIINSVGQVLTQELDLQSLIDLVGDKLRTAIQAENFGIGLYESKSKLLQSVYVYKDDQRIYPDPAPLNAFSLRVARQGRPLVINHNTKQTWKKFGSNLTFGAEIPKSVLMIPILAGRELIGGFTVQDFKRENAYPDSVVRMLETIASNMGTAIQNARLFDETQRLLKETEERNAELAIINSVQEGLASKLDFKEIIELVGAKIEAVFSADVVGIGLYDHKNDLVELPYIKDHGERYFHEPRPTYGAFEYLLKSPKPVLIRTHDEMNQFMDQHSQDNIGGPTEDNSHMIVPMLSGNQVIGVVTVGKLPAYAFSESDVRLLQTLANSMSVALENARLFDETQRLLKETEQRAAELAIINSVQLGLASKLEMQAIFELVGEKIRNIFDAQAAIIATYEYVAEQANYRYIFEKGDRFDGLIIPFNGFHREMIRIRKTILYNENLAEQVKSLGFAESFTPNELPKSSLNVPLLSGDQVLGHVALENLDHEHAFSESDVRLLETLANSMSVALENARLFDETQRLLKETEQRAAELATVNTIGQAMASQLELDALVELIGEQMRQTFRADIVYVALHDHQTDEIHFPYYLDSGQRRAGYSVVLGQGLTSYILQKRQPLLLNHDEEYAALNITRQGTRSRSYLGVPILTGDEAIGVISVQSTQQEGRFGESDLRLLSTIAANVGVAIQNARLYQETQRRAEEMATLAEIGNDIATTLDMEPVLERIAARAQDLLRVRDIALYLREPDGESFRAVVALGTYTEEIKASPVLLGRGITGHVAQTGIAELVNYPGQDPRAFTIPGTPTAEAEPECLMSAPLISRDKVVGLMTVWRLREHGLFTQNDLDFLVSLARQAAIAIESARLYLETQRRASEMSALAQVGYEISATLDLPTVLERIASRAKALLGADTSAVFRPGPTGETFRATVALGDEAEQIKADAIRLGEGIIGSIAQSGIAEVIADTNADPRSVRIPGTPEVTAESLMVAPLLARERVVGLMAVWREGQGRQFAQADLDFLVGLSRQAAIAIENARLYQESQRRASEMAALSELGREISETLDLPTVLERIVTRAGQLLDTPHGFIYLLAPGEAELERKVGVGVYSADRVHRVKPGEGLSGRVWQTDRPIVIDDYDTWPDRSPQGMGLVQAMVGVPLHAGARGVGVIALATDRGSGRTFGADEVELLIRFAQLGGIAIQNARLYEESHKRANEMAALTEIGREISATLDLPTVLERIATRAQAVVNARDVVLRLLESDGSLPAVVAIGRHAEQQRALTLRLGQGLTGHVAQSGVAEIVNFPTQDPRIVHVPGTVTEEDEREAVIVAPLLSREKVIGVMNLWRDRIDDGPFTQNDLDFLIGLSRQAVIAIHNARLFAETGQRLRELASINNISQAMASQLEMDAVIDLVGEKLREVFDAQFIYVALYDRQTNLIHFPYFWEIDHRVIAGEPLVFGQGLTSRIIETGQPQLINSDWERRAVEMGAVALEGILPKSSLGVPIMVGESVMGVISLQNTERENVFTDADVRLLTTIAANVGVALENARLFDEIQRQKQYSEALVQNSPVAIVVIDLDANVVSWNPAAEKLFGYTSAEALGRNVDDLVAKAKDLQGQAAAYNVEASQGVLHAITQRTRKDGTLVDVELSGVPVIVDGDRVGIIAIYHDLSSLKRAEEELRRQKQYFEGVVQNSPMAIITTDLEFNVVSWNPAAEDLFGYAQAEAMSHNLDELIATGDIRDEAVGYSQQASNEGRVHVITRRSRKDGSLVDVEVLALPVILAGEQVGFIAIYHDITERKRAEEALRRQKQYLEAVVQNSPAAIVTIDLNANVVEWNPTAEKLFGYTQAEAIGCNIDDLVAKSDLIHTEAVGFNAQVSSGELIRAITQRTRKDGALIDVEVLALPVIVAEEQVGIIVIYHDITELLRARREAEAANAAKSAFLATMSHEIRTPMNAVIGMSGLLLDTPLDDEQREFAEIIRNSGDALLTIINDILDFSKIEAGKMELDSQPFDLRECVESALDLVATHAAEKGLDLAYVVEGDTPAAIVGDVTRLRQILLNLLTNAVKFTERGEVVLSVAGRKLEVGSRKLEGDLTSTPAQQAVQSPITEYELHFAVRDTGVGIPPDRMDRLFQSFSQVDASTARKYGGTGLGLAISKRLAELMGGAMWAESPSVSPPHAGGTKGGPGATFHFTIHTQAADAPVVTRRDLRGTQPQLQHRRVLIVDDNDTNRRILVLQTRSWGMQPRDTASPAEALDWLRRGDPFDVAILDMHMPDMDGMALAAEIRNLQLPISNLPLILFTSLGRREAGADAVGFAAHLTKPIKPSQLFDALVGIFSEQAVPVQRASVPQGQTDPDMARRHPLRILLAEDNAINQKLALRLLQQMGYRADVAANGLEAIEAIKRQTYDVVLMDVQMPEMDGLEASREINKRWPREQRPRIVAMTANAMQGDREMCLAAGMDDYISKPIRVDELAGALSRSQALEY